MERAVGKIMDAYGGSGILTLEVEINGDTHFLTGEGYISTMLDALGEDQSEFAERAGTNPDYFIEAEVGYEDYGLLYYVSPC